MRRFRILIVVGALLGPAWMITACTSTSGARNADLPLNSACALGFNNDRPCSY
jgi:hypothetical protein